MRLLKGILSSSIGKKLVVAVSGLLMIGFLVSHLAGNLLMLKSPEAFNAYAEYLEHHPLILPAEIGLALLFLSHIAMALKVSYENYVARPRGYDAKESEGGRTWGSATMKYTGLLVLLFLFLHIYTFKFNHQDGVGMFEWTMTYFRLPLYTAFYLIALVGLGFHVGHGFQSAFQTLGLSHSKYTPLIRCGGVLFAIAAIAGFCVLAINGFARGVA